MMGPANSFSDQPIATMFAYDTYAVKECAKYVLMTRKLITKKVKFLSRWKYEWKSSDEMGH